MTSMAASERDALCDLFLEVGPDAPTLCEGWTTRDLAAHLVVRESRPDAALGIVVRPLAGWTRNVQHGAARGDWVSLVDRVRRGARWWPSRIGPVDAAVNGLEYFVHHEDVRRAQHDWQPRELSPAVQEALWSGVRHRGAVYLRSSPVGVVLVSSDGRRVVARDADPSVTVTGAPAELVLLMHGRGEHSVVEVTGDPDAVQRFRDTRIVV